MRFGQFENVMDNPWWTKNSMGKFTTKSALEISRQTVDLGKVHVSTLLHLSNPNISEDCGCCNSSGEVADRVWIHYCRATGIIDQRLKLKQTMRLWRNIEGNSKLREVFKVYWEFNDTILKFVKVIFNLNIQGRRWIDIIDVLQDNRTTSVTRIVKWVPPPNPWFKETLMVPQEGTLYQVYLAFCIRNGEGDLVVARVSRIKDTTSLKA
ncbi:hypothetical protein H5410_022224 [Solanum commersonii]|uniref:Uncharacterized protein n=1 Tax=Solanum commersonii TaxID=4109 RepID=A0A9J5ZG64_SOLCO|nr:hypothetical protein H5410_022224 [Solanum commersonii]